MKKSYFGIMLNPQSLPLRRLIQEKIFYGKGYLEIPISMYNDTKLPLLKYARRFKKFQKIEEEIQREIFKITSKHMKNANIEIKKYSETLNKIVLTGEI